MCIGSLTSIQVDLKAKTRKGNNLENPKHFIVCQIEKNWRQFIVDIFNDFYPNKRMLINAILREHMYYLPINKGAK